MENNKLLALIKSEKKLMLIGLTSGLVLFIGYLLFSYVPLYKTSTKLFIENTPNNDIITSYDNGSIVKTQSGFSNPMFNMVEILSSQELSDIVYSELKSKYPEDLMKLKVKSSDDWNAKLPKLLVTKIEPSSDIIKISINWNNKNHTKDVLNTTINSFRNLNLKIQKASELYKINYLEKQLADIGHQLDYTRKQIKNYKVKHNAVDVDNESMETTKTRLELQKELEMLKGASSFNNQKIHSLSAQLGIRNANQALKSTGIGQDEYLIKLNQNLSDAQQRYYGLLSKFTENYPDVVAVRNEIQSLKNNIEKRKIETLQGISVKRGIYDRPSQDIVTDFARAQADKVSTDAQISSLQKGINGLLVKEAEIPEKVLDLNSLKKNEDSLLIAYSNTKQKYLEAKIKANEMPDNVYQLGAPSKPQLLSIIIISKFIGFLALGFIASLCVAWIKQDIDDKWLNSKEIETVTNKKVLGVIPWIASEKSSSKEFISNFDTITGVAYRDIVNNIVSKASAEQAKILTFVSTVHLRKKPSVIANLAAIISNESKSIIILDTDFQNPYKLLKHLGIKPQNENGLVDSINAINNELKEGRTVSDEFINEQISKCIIPVTLPEHKIYFYYLCASKPVENIYDYVSTSGFKLIVDYLKRTNEYIFIDSPAKPFAYPDISAVVGVSDAIVIMPAKSSSRMDLMNIVEKCDNNNVKVLGIISREENSELERSYLQENNLLDKGNINSEYINR